MAIEEASPRNPLHRREGVARRLLDGFSAIVVLCGLISFALRQLPNPNFWLDESGQYWMSQGLNHDSPLAETAGPLIQGVFFGLQGYNMDPPGFTVLLALWTRIFGDTSLVLRLLPFFIYVLSLALLFVISRRWLRLGNGLSAVMATAVLSAQIPLYYATELRAYGAEILMVLATCWALLRVIASSRASSAIPLVGVLLIGMTASRYYFVIATISAACTYLCLIAVRGEIRPRARQIGIIAVGYVLVASATLFNLGIIGPGNQFAGGQAYARSADSVLTSEDPVGLILRNFFSGEMLATGAFLIIGGLQLILNWRNRHESQIRVGHSEEWPLIWVFVTSYVIFSVVLSALGRVPWNADNRWSIGLWAIAALASLGLARVIVTVLGERLPREWRRNAVLMGGVLVAIASIAIAVRFASYDRPNFRVAGSTLPHAIDEILSKDQPAIWIVDRWAWPTFRWLVHGEGAIDAQRVISAQPYGYAADADGEWLHISSSTPICTDDTVILILFEDWTPGFAARAANLERQIIDEGCVAEVTALSPGEIVVASHPKSTLAD